MSVFKLKCAGIAWESSDCQSRVHGERPRVPTLPARGHHSKLILRIARSITMDAVAREVARLFDRLAAADVTGPLQYEMNINGVSHTTEGTITNESLRVFVLDPIICAILNIDHYCVWRGPRGVFIEMFYPMLDPDGIEFMQSALVYKLPNGTVCTNMQPGQSFRQASTLGYMWSKHYTVLISVDAESFNVVTSVSATAEV